MSLLEAILMGLIQGITEFLPVSSSGHLALFKILFDVESETELLFDMLLHLGTLITICAVFYKDIAKLLTESIYILKNSIINLAIFFHNCYLQCKNNLSKEKRPKTELDFGNYHPITNNSYRKLFLLILVSLIPTGILGIVGKETAELSSKILIVPGICLIITAILLFVVSATKGGNKLPKDITYSDAFFIGVTQGVAILPGLSRSGTTITACLLSGFQCTFAVKYSFLMSIPAILGAMILDIRDISAIAFSAKEVINYVVGTVVSILIGYICIKAMFLIVRKKKFKIFAVYCMIVGILSVMGYFYMI